MSKGQAEKKKEGCVTLFPVIEDNWSEKDKQLKEKVTLSLFSFPRAESCRKRGIQILAKTSGKTI